MKKGIVVFSKIVIVVLLLNVFSSTILYVHGGGSLGFLTTPIKYFYEFPKLVIKVYKEFKQPEKLTTIDPNFTTINQLKYDLFALNGRFEQSKWIISLTNLKNDSVIYEWYLTENSYNKTERNFSHAELRNPILLSDKSLIIYNDETNNLYKIDKTSKIIWHNKDYQFHHGLSTDRTGNIWTCTRKSINLASENVSYFDNYITKIDVKNGLQLYHKSLTEIFKENGLIALVHGMGNQVGPMGNDPLHLNKIEPVLKDGLYWKADDLFISLRNRSLVFLYRPATNKIIRIIQGPFLNQHDVDILSDSTICIFNNNASSIAFAPKAEKRTSKDFSSSINNFSEVLIYNLKDSTYTSIYKNQFIENKIYTRTQGQQQLLSNGDLFVESTDAGKVYLINQKQVLIKKYFNNPKPNGVERPHWIRIYENLNFLNK